MMALFGLALMALAFIVGLGIGYRSGMDDKPSSASEQITVPLPVRRDDDAPKRPTSVYERVSDMRRMFE